MPGTTGTTGRTTTEPPGARALRRRRRPPWRGFGRPSATRTRIIGWVLLLVLTSLAVVTFVTWRLLVQDIDERMDASLRAEVGEFAALTESGINPTTGQPFSSVDEVLRTAITYNLARLNEKFLGYVDGVFRWESRQQAPVLLRDDPRFTALVGSVAEPTSGSYDSAAGEVRYLAIPVRLEGDPARGVIVTAYFADQEREFADQVARLMLLVGGMTTLLAAAGAWVVAGRILRPLRDVADTARTITETDLSGRIPERDGQRDELGELSHTVNAMLDRVQTGVDAQRRFVDDAGHELRTPITIVRGHLDVLDPADTTDVRSTVALVDDELGRMNRLVTDLLLLTRSQQPAFLHPRPVDVAELTTDIFGKLFGLADPNWVLETSAQVEVVLDPQRLTQAVVALADNATRFTGPGARIGLGSQLAGGELRIWVADSGPGVPPEDQERVFQRFARGSTGPRSEGAGLGLSIVSAIAAAHGGRVLLDSVPGRGATFTLVLPGTPG